MPIFGAVFKTELGDGPKNRGGHLKVSMVLALLRGILCHRPVSGGRGLWSGPCQSRHWPGPQHSSLIPSVIAILKIRQTWQRGKQMQSQEESDRNGREGNGSKDSTTLRCFSKVTLALGKEKNQGPGSEKETPKPAAQRRQEEHHLCLTRQSCWAPEVT